MSQAIESPEDVRVLIVSVQMLLGPRFERVWSRHEQMLRSGGPRAGAHRLADAFEKATDGVGVIRLERPLPYLALAAIVEIELVDEIIRYWGHEPDWPGILRGMVDQNDYIHEVVMLCAAKTLRDYGIRVNLHHADGGASPDLSIPVNESWLGVEVKTPMRLHGPRPPLTAEEAESIVQESYRKARRQLRRLDSGLLVVGGLHLTQQDLGILMTAADNELCVRSKDRGHLLGIALMTLGYAGEILPDTRWRGIFPTDAAAVSRTDLQIRWNPHYPGTVEFREAPLGLPYCP